MKKVLIYIILIPFLLYILYNTWQYKQPSVYLWNGLMLLAVIVVYKLNSRSIESNIKEDSRDLSEKSE